MRCHQPPLVKLSIYMAWYRTKCKRTHSFGTGSHHDMVWSPLGIQHSAFRAFLNSLEFTKDSDAQERLDEGKNSLANMW